MQQHRLADMSILTGSEWNPANKAVPPPPNPIPYEKYINCYLLRWILFAQTAKIKIDVGIIV